MNLEYVATNRIPVSSQLGIRKVHEYLELCYWYFQGHIRNPECTPVPEAPLKHIIEGRDRIYKTWKEGLPLEEFNVVNYGHLGFAVQIVYDSKQDCFKLRLFADKTLRTRKLDTTYEPLRHSLTSGPVSLGLNPTREVEDNVDVPKQDFSFADLEKHQVDVLNYWLKDYLEGAKRELKVPEKYEDWLYGDAPHTEEIEEYLFEKDEKEKFENNLRVMNSKVSNLNKSSYVNGLKSHSKLFVEMREDFARRFSEKHDAIMGIALGTLPWFNRKTMNGSFGVLLEEQDYLPNFRMGGFEDNRDNFMDAEIIVPPDNGYCKMIISLFPYTHIIPEFNQLHEEFFEDYDVMRAMYGHELAEVVFIDNHISHQLSGFDILLNTPRMQMVKGEERNQTIVRHKQIDELLVKVGLGHETKKMITLYRDRAKEALEMYRKDIATHLEQPDFDISTLHTLEEYVKSCDEQLDILSKYMS